MLRPLDKAEVRLILSLRLLKLLWRPWRRSGCEVLMLLSRLDV